MGGVFMETTNLNIRTDREVKLEAEKIFEELGLSMTTAINIFLRQTIRENGMPFALKLDVPNATTTAAIAVVCVLGGLAWFYLQHNPISNMQMQVVMASADNDTTVTLPDGTKVWLNKLASIKYPKEFDGSDRKVEIDGEGYFEVTKNPHKPFIVESDVMSVKVLGTVFNFHVDKAHQQASVSLLEGKVRVEGNHDEGMIVLKPGQKACVDARLGSMTVSETDVYKDAMWHEHKTSFNNASVNEIAKMLENIYDVQVVVDPTIDQENTYSGVIKEKETIDSVLDLLQNTLPIHYHVKGSKVFITK